MGVIRRVLLLVVGDPLLRNGLVGRRDADGNGLHGHRGAVVLYGTRVQADFAVAVDDYCVCDEADEEEKAGVVACVG